MAEIRTRPVTFRQDASSTGTETGAGELHLQVFDKRDRTRRAALAWLTCWGLSVASLPIIFAHWVLVPGFFIAGPFVAYRYFNIGQVAKKITGSCPACRQSVELGLEASDQLPMWRYCPQCNASLYIDEGNSGQLDSDQSDRDQTRDASAMAE